MGDNIPNENEVIEEVTKEIGTLRDNFKEQHNSMMKNYEELKATVDAGLGDPLAEEKYQKFAADISTRQEELDKQVAEKNTEVNSRIDNVEVALKRLPKAGEEPGAEQKDVEQFYTELCSLKGQGTYKQMRSVDKNIDAYNGYQKAFEGFLRNHGDERSLTPEDAKAMSVGVDPDGGYTVTPAMSNTIIKRIYESDPIRQLAAVESITTDAIEWMVDWDQMGFGWETETAAGAETTTADMSRKRIPVHIMYAKPRATQQLLEDSGINIENWIGNRVGDRFARAEGAAFVTGDGIGKPRGFLTYDNGTNYGQVEQVTMGAADALTADGFIDVKYALSEYYLNRGTWLMQRATVAAAMKLKNGAGDYIWKPGLLAGDAQSTLVGMPLRMSPTMPAIAANALSVAIADWREAYMIVDRLGISIQRDPYTVKPFVEFYTRKRLGADIVNYEALKLGIISV